MTRWDAGGAEVRVVGVGGAGGNAVRRMRETGIRGATLVAANTDGQALEGHPADLHVVLGRRSTRGLGAGGRADVGFSAAQESAPELVAAMDGADLVFVAAGLGGGTGTGAAPLVAHLAHEVGALVVGVVTMPFAFEGGRRRRLAQAGLEALAEQVDSLLVIENDRLLELADEEPSMLEALARADDVLSDGVHGIGDLVTQTGLINLDFADVAAVLRDGGRAVMGLGTGRGPERAVHAVEAARRSPLLADSGLEGARGVLLSFTVDPELGLGAIHRAAARVQAVVDDDAEILFGVTVDPTLVGECRVTLVAAGIGASGASADASSDVRSREELSAQTPSAHAPASHAASSGEGIDRPYAPAHVRRRNALVMLER